MASPEQLRAICHKEGPMLVLAGPGSGKTFVLTRRVWNLVQYHKVPPDSIVVVTFTKAAAVEMQKKCEKLFGGNLPPITFGTFHAIFYSILKNESYLSFQIFNSKEKHDFIKSILSEVLRTDPSEIGNQLIDDWLTKISQAKNGMNLTDDDTLVTVLKKYQENCKKIHRMDFDDLGTECRSLLKHNPEILKKLQKKYFYFLVDECQDMNAIQYDILMLLSGGKNVFAVGDDDQSIYGFRGANPDILFQLEKDCHGCEKVILNQNYRCCESVTEIAGKMIVENKNRFLKNIISVSGIKGKVMVRCFASGTDEIKWMTDEIKTSWNQFTTAAIITRNNFQLEFWADYLTKEKIPFFWKNSGESVYEKKEFRDLLAFLNLSVQISKGIIGRKEILRLSRLSGLNISRTNLEKETMTISEFVNIKNAEERKEREKLIQKCRFISGKRPQIAIHFFRKQMKYDTYLSAGKSEVGLELMEIWEKESANFSEIDTFLLYCRKEKEKWNENQKKMQKTEKLQLLTMHSAKGLEFDYVFLPEINDNIIPGKNLEGDVLEEERRVLYVAMTRAKRALYITCSEAGKGNGKGPSRLVKNFIKVSG